MTFSAQKNCEKKQIEECCICKVATESVYKLHFLEVFGMAKDYTQEIRICPKCGFIYTANPFSEEPLENRYKNLSKFEFDTNDIIVEEDSSYKKRCVRQYNFIRNSVDSIKSIFEVGSASGYNLSIYKNNNINTYGIEPSKNNVLSCKDKYGIELFNGMFQEYIEKYNSQNKYDLIFLSHVLEHIINPYSFIKALSEINKRYMFIEVPTLDYKFCDEPFGMFAEEHVNYFTFESLRNLMNSLGYNIVDANIYFSSESDIPAGYPCISTIWDRNDSKIHSLTSSKKPNLSAKELLQTYIKKSEEMEIEINAKIDAIDDKTKIAVWGTGHHTSRLLGMTNLCNKNIVKFYDSDIRKKDTLYFNKKISPFDPKDITNGEVEMVIISTYVAQQAITKILNTVIDCKNIRLY
ncbi:MAG: methyltransferase domain-containing protein [Termitinemataceae bacterium]|nr:MAG: methyltransferase domain-containing protein [Termitinemataceae bacterium]